MNISAEYDQMTVFYNCSPIFNPCLQVNYSAWCSYILKSQINTLYPKMFYVAVILFSHLIFPQRKILDGSLGFAAGVSFNLFCFVVENF